MLRGLFEGAQYNSEAGAKCAVYSRARSNQGNTVDVLEKYMVWVPHNAGGGGGGRHVGKVLEHQINTAVEIDNLSKSN